MSRKRTRDLVNLSQQAAQMEKTELSSSRESSPAPSQPPELQQFFEDSDEYFPEGSSSSDSDSSQDIQWKVKRKKHCTGMEVLTTSNEVSLQSQSTTTSTTQSQKPSSFAAEEDIPILPGTSEDRQQSIGDDTSPATPVLDTPNSPSTSQHVRKSESRMIRKQRKINRNTGKAYQDSKGKEVRGRTCRGLEDCRMKCGERFSYCDRNDIFNSYWALGDHSKRVSYIASLITVKEKKSERKRTSSPKRHFNRTVNYSYSLRIDGKLNDICKKCFMLTFDETNKFISNVIKKSSSSTGGITPIDKRGSHSPPNKISEEILEQARQHILSIPAYESHYSRRHTNKKYLPSHYTLALMYREYCKIADKPICRTLYERIFHEPNLAIKSPKNDTCNLCDTLNMRMSLASEEERVNIEEKLRTHQSLAELAYESKKNDKKLVKQMEV